MREKKPFSSVKDVDAKPEYFYTYRYFRREKLQGVRGQETKSSIVSVKGCDEQRNIHNNYVISHMPKQNNRHFLKMGPLNA